MNGLYSIENLKQNNQPKSIKTDKNEGQKKLVICLNDNLNDKYRKFELN